MLKSSALIALIFIVSLTLRGQSIPNPQSINVEELSDEQIEQLMLRAEEMGYSQDDIYSLAGAQGVSAGQMQMLGQRINAIQSTRSSTASQTASFKVRNPPSRASRTNPFEPLDTLADKWTNESLIFGYAFFNNGGGDVNNNLPTPPNYVLGAGDQLFIDIYGASEQYYEANISADGYILINNIGPLSISGLTISNATEKIKARLSRIYPGLLGDNPNTYLQVTLGTMRTIQINVVGEVKKPGVYRMSSFANVLNVLYQAGGPNVNGTMRQVQVFRNGKLISTVDLYDYLLMGSSANNVMLQDNDLVLVGAYNARVIITGQVKRPGVYEISADETLGDLLGWAGGFNEEAYKERISVVRNNSKQRQVADVYLDQFEVFGLKSGDQYSVGQILDRYDNRVQIKGAVYRPGSYSYVDQMTVSDLIKRADGLRGDAFTERGLLLRSNTDFSSSTTALDFNSTQDLSTILKREDILVVQSKADLQEEQYIQVSGEVNAPGVIRYSEGMSVKDAIFLSMGFTSAAQSGKVEISRMPSNQSDDNLSEVININLDEDLGMSAESANIELAPFDHIFVRRNPDFFREVLVTIEGQVVFPGQYALTSNTERVSSLISRSGGLNNLAYADGATLIRRTEFYATLSENQRKQQEILSLISAMDSTSLSESDEVLVDNLYQELEQYLSQEENQNLTARAKQERLKELARQNSLISDIDLKEAETIAIDLNEIVKRPGSEQDLILQEGDIINVPRKQNTVRLRGRVLYPTSVRYEDQKSAKHYINSVGGFDNRANRKRTYVVYANGEVSRTKSFLFFRSYPDVQPGSEVIVPNKPVKVVNPTDMVALMTGLATIALLISQINF